MIWQRGTRIAARLVGAMAGAVALLGVLAALAQANHYDVYSCNATGAYQNPSASAGVWSLSNSADNKLEIASRCGGSGLIFFSGSGYNTSQGQAATATVNAPAGLSLERVQTWIGGRDYGAGSGSSSQRNAFEPSGGSGGLSLDGTANWDSNDTSNGGINSSNYHDISLASLPGSFSYSLFCPWAASCRTGGDVPGDPSGFDSVMYLYGAIISVHDNQAPSLSVASSGLFAASGRQQGTVPVTVSASHVAGIARLEVYAGTSSSPSLVQDFTQTNHCDFSVMAPCQSLSGYQWPLDTTRMPDGTYYVTVKAYDPAGNVAAQSSPNPVTIDNAPAPSAIAGQPPTISGTPLVGSVLTASTGGWNGSNLTYAYQWQHCLADGSGCTNLAGATDATYTPASSDVGHTVRVVVTATNPEGSAPAASAVTSPVAAAGPGVGSQGGNPQGANPGPTATLSSRGAANGGGASDRARFSNTHRYVQVPFGRAMTVTGRLTDENGSPITGARLDVAYRVNGQSSWQDMGSVVTDASGTYRVAVAAGPSRLLRLGYRSHVNDSAFAADVDVQEDVAATGRLRIAPGHVRNHQRVVFLGRVLGAGRGQSVEIQAQVGQRWVDVIGLRTGRRGAFRGSYRFMRTPTHQVYRFRVQIRPQAGFPFVGGQTNTAAVTVN